MYCVSITHARYSLTTNPDAVSGLNAAEVFYTHLTVAETEKRLEYPQPLERAPEHLHEHYDLIRGIGLNVYRSERKADWIGLPISKLLRENGEDFPKLLNDVQNYQLHQEAERLLSHFPDEVQRNIHDGRIPDAAMLCALRSFAWTVCEMASREDKKPENYTFHEHKRMGTFIQKRDYLNFTSFSWCPGLCDHADWHVFYVPDMYLYSERSEDLRILCGKDHREAGFAFTSVFGIDNDDLEKFRRMHALLNRREETLESLEALRMDLIQLHGVMMVIAKGLEHESDEVLCNVLAAWAAMSVAAKEPFYSDEEL